MRPQKNGNSDLSGSSSSNYQRTLTPDKSASPRLDGLDLARFVAFFGMVIVNFKIAMGAEGDTGVLNFLTRALEGRAAATFVVLAGIGLGLAALRSDLGQTVSVTIKRAIFLFVVGLLNFLVFDADILHYYAFYFLFGVLLLSLSNHWLVTSIVLLNTLFVVMMLSLDYDKGWNWDDYTYSDFWSPAGFIRNLFFNGWHPVIPWLGFLLLGIVLSRLKLAERGVQHRLILFGVAAFVVAEALSLALTGALNAIDPELGILATTEPVPPMPLYLLAGSGAASAVIGLCLRFSGQLEKRGLLHVLTPAGRQTLSLYIAHILVGMGTLEGLGMLGGQSLVTALFASALFCVIATIYALIWHRFFKRGPIEALMRRVAG
ncbi:DUF418 domain-containing protein [Marinobacter nauticus]|uniref:DUF418 domain-containing protein n=1 Tax=Marinobacter nauticus TaxID=2743 RepID=UPI004044ED5A